MVIPRSTPQRRSRALVAATLAAVMALILTACGSGNAGDSSAAANGNGNLIGVSFYTNQVARFNFEDKKMKEVAAANGDEVVSNFANGSIQTQISQIQSMMQRGIKVLVLNQVESEAFAPIVKQAQAQGIKVISYDDDVVGAKVDYVIKRDNVALGALQAQSVIDHLPGGTGKVAIIRGDPASPNMVDISKSYDKMILNNPKINVVYDSTTPGWDQAAAQRNAEAALQKDPDINAFLVMWDNGAQAVAQALKAAGKDPGTVWSTGVDAAPASLTYIAQGWQGQTTWTAIDQMATDAMNIAHTMVHDTALPPGDSTTASGVPVKNPSLSSITKDKLCEFVTKTAPQGWVTTDAVFGTNSCG